MSPEDYCPEKRAFSAATSNNVSLSKWVNERFPNWEQLLSARDVARLTRRPQWVLMSMMVLGRFPQKRRFHGRGVGWLRADVLDWMAKDLRMTSCHTGSGSLLRRRSTRQMTLPLEGTGVCAARVSRSACSVRRTGRA
jgi:predicted DNA-binding transcriptional regulator AlpA